MTDCRAHALILLEIAERSDLPEHKMQAVAVAQMWLTIAVLEDANTLWMGQVETERPVLVGGS